MLTQETRQLLKSLTSLNNSMIIKPRMTGNDEFKNVTFLLNLDKLEDDFPEFGIFDTGTFLQAMDLLEDPEITYDAETKRIKAKDLNTSLEYITSDPESLDYVQVKETVITSTLNADSVLEADISTSDLAKIKKATSVFKNFDTLKISSENGQASLEITNLNTFSKNNNNWSMKLDTELNTKDFDLALPLDSIMKLPAMDYSLQIKYNPDRDAYRVVMTNELITFVMSLKT